MPSDPIPQSMTMQAEAIVIAGEEVLLSADRALFWPRESLLVIADLHLGKDDVFRRAGIAVPQGSTAHDLQRLQHLVEQFGARRLLILGDILHGAIIEGADWTTTWRDWCGRHPRLQRLGLIGNHDRALREKPLPGIELIGDALAQSPFHFSHEPLPQAVNRAIDGERLPHRICGHLHPVFNLNAAGVRARLPCFWTGIGQTVLPAFTSLAGGYEIRAEATDAVWVCAGPDLVQVPGAYAGSRRSGDRLRR